MMRPYIFLLIMLLGVAGAADAGDGALTKTEQARTLFKKRRYSEAAALARQVFVQQPDGSTSDELRVLLCKAKVAGENVGDSSTAYRGSTRPAGQDSVSIEQPEKIFGSQPQFKRSTDREGQVIVTAEIDEDGCVQDLKVTNGLNKHANQVVLDTFRDWVFRPATLLGQPVRVPNEWTVNVSFGRR